ncbi:MAG TPA: alpha/beta hydrolase [Pirellulales bacterium]|nr:alpha/beta hydrolase [Pirellulales bacterium]
MLRRFRRLFCLAAFVTAIACAGWAVAGEIEHEPGIEYANPADQHLKLDLTRPKQIEGRVPAVVCIHGGGWAGGTREGWQWACDELARRGFVAVTVTYRLTPAYHFPDHVEDVQAAVRWVRDNAERLKVDPSRIGVVGDSAGGHLAQCLGVGADVDRLQAAGKPGGAIDPNCRVACVVNIYGPNDLTREVPKNVAGLLRNFLGDPEKDHLNYILASPYYWVTPDAAPTLIIHGTKDDVVPFEQAQVMHERLKAAGVEVELLPIEGAKHGFGGADAEKAHAAMYDWLERHLKRNTPAS